MYRLNPTIRISLLAKVMAGALVLVAATIVMLSLGAVSSVNDVNRTWNRYDEHAAAKTKTLSELRDALGYGGLIHEFKNLVLRGDRPRIVRVHAELRRIMVALSAYRSHGTTDLERAAIADLEAVLSKYRKAVATVERMQARGASPREIDRAVGIDDTPAFNALAVLDEQLLTVWGNGTQGVHDSVSWVKTYVTVTAVSVSALLAGLVAFFVWAVRLRLVRPLLQLAEATSALAGGARDTAVPHTDSGSEIGDVARAVEIFNRSAVQYEDAERLRRAAEAEKVREENLRLEQVVAERTAELTRRGEQLHTIMESLFDALIVIDPRGTIEMFNPAAEWVFGYEAEEVLGHNVRMLMPPQDAEAHDGYLENFRRTTHSSIIDSARTLYGRRKDGRTFPMELSVTSIQTGSYSAIIGVVRDLTDQVRKARKTEQLGHLLDESGSEVFVVDAHTGRFIEANAGALRNLGYTLEEMRSLSPYHLNPNLSREQMFRRYDSLKRGDAAELVFEGRHRRKDGSEYDTEVRIHYSANDGSPVFFSMVQDITERVRAREALEKARDDAEAANRTKSSFLANMSHELRTPLNAVIGYSEMLTEIAEEEGDVEYIPDLEKIRTAGRHLQALINDILDLSKIEAGKVELEVRKFSLAPALEEVVSMVQPLMDRNGNVLDVTLPDAALSMMSDETRVRQILFNLLSNAAKFTENGSVRVSVEREEAGAESWITFRIADTGIGLSPDQKIRLFQDFSQADASTTRKYGGTGLGLSISRRFARIMGGEIHVESEVGKGSVFSVRLPARLASARHASEEFASVVAAPVEITAIDGSGRDVLIIDDDSHVTELLVHFLSAEGFGVHIARSGEEGIELARKIRPAALILDVLLPGADGWAILKQIKSQPEIADIPVIMCTVVDEKVLGYRLGAADYLTKPIDRKQLLQVIGRLTEDRPSHVLLVEDDPASREMVSRTLSQAGHRVTAAENGRRALAALDRIQPALVLLDLAMPEMDGFEFLEELRQREGFRDVPVVVVTAHDLTAEQERTLSENVTRVIRKFDYSFDDLVAELCVLSGDATGRSRIMPQGR